MATLFLTVFEGASETARGEPIQEMIVTIGAGSLKSAAITGTDRRRRVVRAIADVACFVTWGADPTALGDGTGGRAVAAEVAEYWDIEAGHLVAVIERT